MRPNGKTLATEGAGKETLNRLTIEGSHVKGQGHQMWSEVCLQEISSWYGSVCMTLYTVVVWKDQRF